MLITGHRVPVDINLIEERAKAVIWSKLSEPPVSRPPLRRFSQSIMVVTSESPLEGEFEVAAAGAASAGINTAAARLAKRLSSRPFMPW